MGRESIYCLLLSMSLAACNRLPEPALVATNQSNDRPFRYQLPNHIPQPVFASNPPTEAGVLLGKALFQDPGLSANGAVACATCHAPNLAFADGLRLSTLGVTGAVLPRHTPTIQNLAWDSLFFWDGGVRNLESLPPAPIQEHDEMGNNMGLVVKYLNRSPLYRNQVKRAFGKDSADQPVVLKALAQYMKTITSFNSRYDAWRQGKVSFSQQEILGEQLVAQKCSPCHKAPFFTDHDFHNNGLQAVYNDPYREGIRTGRYRITFNEADRGAFKTPTLRNVMASAPYMHDGRIATIQSVLDHYSDQVIESRQLASQLKAGAQNDNRPGIRLSNADKAAITAFLNTLTDQTFLNQK